MKQKSFLAILSCILFSANLFGGDIISLNGKWDLQYWPQGLNTVTSPEDLCLIDKDLINNIPATVPGNVEIDLEAAGIIPDPQKGTNIYLLRPYEGYQWCYTRHFKSPEFGNSQSVILRFNGIDCLSTIYLNGQFIGATDNMFIEHSFDVSKILIPNGDNELKVILRSAVLEAQNYDLSEIVVRNDEQYPIRKAPSQYGWDIMPRLVSAGLWRDVELEILDPARIKNVHWTTLSVDADKRTATEAVCVEFKLPFELYDKSYCEIELSHNGKMISKTRKILLKNIFRHQFHIKDAELWWPRGYGESTLYEARVRLLDENGKILDEICQNIGLRTVELDRTEILSKDKQGRFCFIINGEKIFVKGTNWVPLDACHSRDAMRIKSTLDLVIEANCNMIRCWGGNVYEDHDFFNICDANGIMVWQDFAMACSFTPNTPEFQEKIYKEAKSIILKLRNHPSLVLWAGNNENDQSVRWKNKLRAFTINPNIDVISREILPRVLMEYDLSRPYLPSSPYYSHAVYENGEPYEDYLPENHLWGPRGYYKAPFYNRANCLFVSEIGYHGCPGKESLEKMFTADMVYPWTDKQNFKWNEEWLAKSVCEHPLSNTHKKRNDLMINQCKALFGTCPNDLDDFIFASQSVQAEAIKYFIELWRSAKFDKTGILWWNVRDGWPILSDAVCDYYMNKKRAFYYIKNVQHNVCVMVRDNADGHLPLVAVNDTREPASGSVSVKDVESGKVLYNGTYQVEANGKTVITELPKLKGQGIVLLTYTANGKKMKNHFLYGEAPFDLKKYMEWIERTGIYFN